ncbi:hypothetical protein D3C80_641870 [compost metagenome]
MAPDRRCLVGELVRHPLAAVVIAQLLRVDRDRLEQTSHPLGAFAQPDIGIARVAEGTVLAALNVLLEQSLGELG